MNTLGELTAMELEESLEQVTHQIAKLDSSTCPLLPQPEPAQAEVLARDLMTDLRRTTNKYVSRRILVEGVVTGIYPSDTGYLLLTLSARPRGRCVVLACIPKHRRRAVAPVGQRMVCRGSCLFVEEPYGMVMGDCELL